MVDYFALALTHGLLAFAAWRLVSSPVLDRPELDWPELERPDRDDREPEPGAPEPASPAGKPAPHA